MNQLSESNHKISPLSLTEDSYGRSFHYLRLSLTDVCNFRCRYCLPQGYQRNHKSQQPLQLSEILRLIRAFARLGFWKIRLTGGEPTLRPDLLQIVEMIHAVPGIQKIALTTNGHHLNQLALPLYQAGLTALNVSVDSLDRQNFARITGMDRLPEILDGIQAALKAGFTPMKVNVVLLKGLNDHELSRFQEWIQDLPIHVRFIELMRTGDLTQNKSGESSGPDFFTQHHLSAGTLQFELLRSGWSPVPRLLDNGPAVEFAHPRYLGRIGIIAPYSSDFCQSCNRLRVTSQGCLRLCLFGEKDHSMRHLLQSDDQVEELEELIRDLVNLKANSHLLNQGHYGITRNFSQIGG